MFRKVFDFEGLPCSCAVKMHGRNVETLTVLTARGSFASSSRGFLRYGRGAAGAYIQAEYPAWGDPLISEPSSFILWKLCEEVLFQLHHGIRGSGSPELGDWYIYGLDGCVRYDRIIIHCT